MKNELKPKFLQNKYGFTLIETLIVISIIVILTAALIPKISAYADNARTARAINDISTIKTIIEAYTADEGQGTYPSGGELDPVTGEYKKTDDYNYIGTILQKQGIKWYDIATQGGMTDPWGRPYVYVRYIGINDNQMHYIILSTGKDGIPGTSDDIYATDAQNAAVSPFPTGDQAYQSTSGTVQIATSTSVKINTNSSGGITITTSNDTAYDLYFAQLDNNTNYNYGKLVMIIKFEGQNGEIVAGVWVNTKE